VPAPVILSPHPDDAVLSLWHVLARPGPVRVLNVFGGAPRGGAGDQRWDRLTGADDPVARAAERHDEDRAALAQAGRRPDNLGFADGQHRDADPDPQSLADAIARETGEDAPLLAPATLDGHRDHRLVLRAALALRDAGAAVALYADVPHATLYGWPAFVTGAEPNPRLRPEVFWNLQAGRAGIDLETLAPRVTALDPDALAAKRQAVRSYASQVPALECEFALFARPDVLAYEVVWPLF
jgi:LmbE family N-acetylglucosaminyl deacetylase